MDDELKAAKEEWKQKEAQCESRDVSFETVSGEPVEMLYTPEDVADLNYPDDLGFPGPYPFTRGVYENMYRGRLWTMRMFSGSRRYPVQVSPGSRSDGTFSGF